jgi:tRNA(fMet)-specific endonuclease VapC
MACLDTSVLLDLRSRNPALRKRAIEKMEDLRTRGEELTVSRGTWAELFVGVARSVDPVAEEAEVRSVLEPLTVLEFDERAARLFGEILAHLQRLGRPSGDMDVLIAATAMSAGHALVTRDLDHFARMPGLVVETY